MSRGGGSREWLTPIRPDGTRWDDARGEHIAGTHTGFSKALNIVNPQPGMSYAYANSDPRERWIARGKGYVEIHPGDPDHPAYMDGASEDTDAPTPLDSSGVYQDIVPMRIPTHVLAERLADNDREARSRLRLPENTFLGGATEGELRWGAHGQSTRFAMRNHATQVTVGDEVVEQMTPTDNGPQPRRGITQS